VISVFIVVILIGPKSLAFSTILLTHGHAVAISNVKGRAVIAPSIVIAVRPLPVRIPIVAPAVIGINVAALRGIALQLSSLMLSLRAVITMLIDCFCEVLLILPDATPAAIPILSVGKSHASQKARHSDSKANEK
jgi:hypothetical protein